MSASINRSKRKSVIPTVVTQCDLDAVQSEPPPETDEFGAINLSTSGGRSRDDSTQPSLVIDAPPEVAAPSVSTTICDRERRAGRGQTTVSTVTSQQQQQLQMVRHPTRMLMRDWLIEQAETGDVPGLEWLDKDKTLMKIPWIHASKSVWSRDDHCKLFENWAIYTGKYLPERDQPNPRRWKANFRCALNSLPDIEEEPQLSCKNGENGFKVYRFNHTSRSQKTHTEDRRGRTDWRSIKYPSQESGESPVQSLSTAKLKTTKGYQLSILLHTSQSVQTNEKDVTSVNIPSMSTASSRRDAQSCTRHSAKVLPQDLPSAASGSAELVPSDLQLASTSDVKIPIFVQLSNDLASSESQSPPLKNVNGSENILLVVKNEPGILKTVDDAELCGDVDNEVVVVSAKKRRQNDVDVKSCGKTIAEKEEESKILGQVYHVVTPSPVGRNGDHCYYIHSK